LNRIPVPESTTSNLVPSLILYFRRSSAGIVVCPFLVTSTSSVIHGAHSYQPYVVLVLRYYINICGRLKITLRRASMPLLLGICERPRGILDESRRSF
jgi:hypothetical protein